METSETVPEQPLISDKNKTEWKVIKNYHSRKFLNKETGSAMIEASYEKEEITSPDEDTKYSISSYVSISDCSRKIILELSTFNNRDQEKVLYKLDLLIAELTELRKQFGE